MSNRKKLPIGIQTFRELREEDHYYVDKTSFIQQLINGGKHYFLSRPRRFGKSLLVDTMKELFEGNETLFSDLTIHDNWDWSVKYPVVRLDFSGESFSESDSLHIDVMDQLANLESLHGISGNYQTAPHRFRNLVTTLHKRTSQRVVVLVDEYDAPILSTLDNPEQARKFRDYLRGLYSSIKFLDSHIRFSFLTGVSKFSKVNLFSGLNNLRDITLSPQYSAICGYTDRDLDEIFAPELVSLDREAIRDWYNGYSWCGETKVYNPFDILLLFANHEFDNYWSETGTPKFLVETLIRRRISSVQLDGLKARSDLLSSFDVEAIAPEALLFQTGYLTIESEEHVAGETYYRLRYPNREVRQSLNGALLDYMVGNQSSRNRYRLPLYERILADDLKGFGNVLRAFYASIPFEWYTNNDIARFEGHYVSVFYSLIIGLGLGISVEDSTNAGRLDLSFAFEDRVYIFEFKVLEQAAEGTAMAQLKSRNYAEKYRTPSTSVTLIGIEFSAKERNIASFEVDRLVLN